MSVKKFLKENPPIAVCKFCGNPIVLKEDSPKGQVIHCIFCNLDTVLPLDTTVDTIKAPFGSMIVSISQGLEKNNANED